MIGIYCITNLINNKKYIGQSINIENRWRKHKRNAFNQNRKECNRPLYKAIRKYGLDNFKFEIIEECKIEDLNAREIYWISFYNAADSRYGYNLGKGGYLGNFNKLNLNLIENVIKDLQNFKLSKNDIAIKYNISLQTLNSINSGRSWHKEYIKYPIRPNKNVKCATLFKCKLCGAEVSRKDGICKKCSNNLRKVKLPSYEELFTSFYKLRSAAKVAEKYNISTMLLKKWCREYGINAQRKNEYIERYEVEFLGKNPKKHIENYGTKVAQLDPETKEIVQIFSNRKEVLKNFNSKSFSNITRACNVGGKAFGYYWKYIK